MKEFITMLNADIKPFAELHCTSFVSIGVFSPLAHSIAKSHNAIILHPFFTPNGYTYEVGTEHAVCALLLWGVCENLGKKTDELEGFLENLDIGYLSSESNISEEEALEIGEFLCAGKCALLLGRDLYWHSKSLLIARLLGIIARLSGAQIYLQDLSTRADSLQSVMTLTNDMASEFENLPQSDGAFIYQALASDLGALKNFPNDAELLMPHNFIPIFKLKNIPHTPSSYTVTVQNGTIQTLQAKIFDELKGTIAILRSQEVLSYPFCKITSLQGGANV